MNLVIRAQSLQGEPLSQVITCRFDERGGTIGRSDANTLTLPDPERHVSRLQAEVVYAASRYTLRNVGSSNPIVVNGRPLNPGEGVTLAAGDELVIGAYTLSVAVEGGGSLPGRAGVAPDSVVRASAVEPRTDPARRTPAVDPFADLLGTPPPPASAAPRLPDDYDPFAVTAPPRPGAPADPFAVAPSGPAASADPFAAFPPPGSAAPGSAAPPPLPSGSGLTDLLGSAGAAGSSLDAAFGLGPAADASDPMAAFLAAAPSPGTRSPPSADPLAALFGPDPLAADAQTGPAVFNHTPDLQAAYDPPPLRRERPVPTPRPAASQAGADALWAAFCAGAGLRGAAASRLPEAALMQLLGATLRRAVEGTVRLAALRTAAKQELRLPVTVIQSRDNNPLKFAVDADSAMAQLLQPPLPGFLDAAEAMRDVMDDLVGHHFGTLAGTRAALEGVLQRFEPAPLEEALASRGVLDALLPMQRRARLWELYLQHHAAVREQAQEDFQTLFGRAFARAYEEQLDRLAAARSGG